MDAEEARTIGYALWRVRDERRRSLQVIADLAGMSRSHLSRIERGECSPTLREILALADALQVSVSDLTRGPVPAPGNGHIDSTVEAVRLALDAVEVGRPGGGVVPVGVLADQVARIHAQRRACQFAEVATDLPGLIRHLHTTLATGTNHGRLLELAVYLHVHVTRIWLGHAAAPADLQSRVVFLARRLAREHGEVTTLAVAGFAVAGRLLSSGAFELGRAELDSLTLPPVTAGTAGLVCALTTTHALVAVLDGRQGDADAPMDTAAEVAERFSATGDTDSLGFVHAPADIGIERMWLALHAKEPDRAVRVAESVQPESHPFRLGQGQYWLHYGCALAQLRGRHEDAVRALRTAEDIQPTKVLRDAMVRDTLVVLLRRSRRDAVGQQLRDMARRAGLAG